jgi:hypothetical protein
MYKCIELNKSFDTLDEMIKALHQSKSTIIAQKKALLKKADAISFCIPESIAKEEGIEKANEPIEDLSNLNELTVLAIINTTNLMDSHMDVHIPGIWKKSLSENKSIMHLQEHQMKFDKIISDGKDLQAFTKYYNWVDLGFPYSGKTQALVFKSKVKKERNEFMFNQYGKGYVKEHSVGMNYVKIDLAINNQDYKEEFAIWEKYINKVANIEKAEEFGYFWAVTEAKVREGSAVPLGSNWATPTLENNKTEPSKDTQKNNQPSDDTEINYESLTRKLDLLT